MNTHEKDLTIAVQERYISDYTDHDLLQKGSFSTVYSAQQKLPQRMVAIKVTDNSTNLKKQSNVKLLQSFNEQKILAHLSLIPEIVPNVVGYIDSWIEPVKTSISPKSSSSPFAQKQLPQSVLDIEAVYTCLELCQKGSIANMQGEIGETSIRKILLEMSKCLKGLHEIGIVHLDIKPDNILKTMDNQYKLADWGLARNRILTKGEFFLEGDSRYLDKDLLDDHNLFTNEKKKYDLATADVFSLGMSLYQLIVNEDLPNFGEDWHELRSQPLLFPQKIKEKYSQSILRLIREMTGPSFSRPSFQEILKKPILQDSYRKELLWQQILNKKLVLELKELQEDSQQTSGMHF